MRYFLRVHQVLTIAASIVLAAALLIPAGTRSLPLPGLDGMSSLGMPLALFLPVVIAIALVYGLSAGDPWLEAVAARPLPAIDAVFSVFVAFGALAVYAAVWFVFGDAWSLYPLEAGRNVVGYVGLALMGRVILGPRLAGLLPVVVAIGVALLGFHANGSPRWWAWPVADARDEFSWLAAALILVLGAVTTAFGFSRTVGD
jgi:hypothetical protein